MTYKDINLINKYVNSRRLNIFKKYIVLGWWHLRVVTWWEFLLVKTFLTSLIWDPKIADLNLGLLGRCKDPMLLPGSELSLGQRSKVCSQMTLPSFKILSN